jgi:uncharacterized protein
LDSYEIAFTGLASGTHNFDFQVSDRFFEQVEDTEIHSGEVSVAVRMVREERMMDLHFHLQGTVMLPCDRCNDPIEVTVEGDERLIVKLGEQYLEESDEVQVIPESAHQIDLAPFIYEYIHLLLPIRRVHGDDENGVSRCNPDVIRKLQEMNEQHAHDPRWDALNKLKKS